MARPFAWYCPSIVKVIWEKDLAGDSPVPWYMPLDKNSFSISSFRLTAVGRFITKNMVGQRNLLSIPIISLFTFSSLSHWERKHFQVHHAFVLETILKYLFIFIGEGSRIYGTRSKGKPKGSGFSGKGSWRIGWRWQVNFHSVLISHSPIMKQENLIQLSEDMWVTILPNAKFCIFAPLRIELGRGFSFFPKLEKRLQTHNYT